MELKNTDMEKEAESTNNEDQVLSYWFTDLLSYWVTNILDWINVLGNINEHRRYVSSKCKICQTVTYVYKLKTTKDHEYARSEAYNSPSADVLVNRNVITLHSHEEFLSNSNNKQNLIKVLAKHFRGDGYAVIEYEGHIETKIVTTARDMSCFKQRVSAKADDTDILVLLFYFWNSEMGDIILQSMSKNKEKMANIKNIFSHLNKTVVKKAGGGFDEDLV